MPLKPHSYLTRSQLVLTHRGTEQEGRGNRLWCVPGAHGDGDSSVFPQARWQGQGGRPRRRPGATQALAAIPQRCTGAHQHAHSQVPTPGPTTWRLLPSPTSMQRLARGREAGSVNVLPPKLRGHRDSGVLAEVGASWGSHLPTGPPGSGLATFFLGVCCFFRLRCLLSWGRGTCRGARACEDMRVHAYTCLCGWATEGRFQVASGTAGQH